MIVKILTGLLAAGALAGAVVVADQLPIHEPAPATVDHLAIAPLQQAVACPGHLEIPVGDISSGDADLDSGSDDVQFETFTSGSNTKVDSGFASDGPVAASIERVGGGDIAGLAAVTCVRPSMDQWLVGGATTLGASARLVLTNPAEAPVEVEVVSYGPIGQEEEPMVIVVGPESQRSVLLEGTIPENPALTLHVVSNGTGIVANVQDSRLDGFEPAGTDWVTRAADPGTSIVIPAVGPSDPSVEGASASVSLLAPEGANVSLALVTDDGTSEWPGASELNLEPGVVTVIQVPKLSAGAVEVRSDAPVVAAGVSRLPRESQTGRDGSIAFDTMWVAGQSASDAPHSLVAVTDSPELSVYAREEISLRVTNQDGEVVATQDIPARTVQRVSVDASAGDVLTVGAGVEWVQVVSTDDGFVTAVAPSDSEVADLDVAVRVDGYVPVP
ncbi:DUF5719 family protein [Demequina oxidasica]|uniref:DUF5719 family protein n=1 Tax=Demequina oxidasica TaxID=676199 RepID=UPI000782D396|nr:DUF5719 family protein [Demequina oxidasica]